MKKFIFLILFFIFIFITYMYNNNYSEKYKKELSLAYSLLQDDESKEIFNSLVNYYDSGKTDGFWKVKVSDYESYQHPVVHMKKGDVVIDGGTFRYKDGAEYADIVGLNGKVIGFEPEPYLYNRIVEEIKQNNKTNFEVYEYGLLDKNGEATFALNYAASSFFNNLNLGRNIKRKTVTLDSFLAEHNIKKVDFIEMDIESAELPALKGAEKTLIKDKPRLAICIYHTPKNLFDILLYINSLNLGYKFYIGHHGQSTIMYETVLYAIAEQ